MITSDMFDIVENAQIDEALKLVIRELMLECEYLKIRLSRAEEKAKKTNITAYNAAVDFANAIVEIEKEYSDKK